jgi:hypothetical protein
MASRKRLVAFCGAGFSASVGYPLMNSFASYLRHSDLLTPDEIADFDHVQAVCNDIAAVTGGTARNIEQLMSLLDLLSLTQPEYRFKSTNHIKTPSDATNLLRRALYGVYSPPREPRTDTAWPLISLSSEYDLTVITTNYDLHIEGGAAAQYQQIEVSPNISAGERYKGISIGIDEENRCSIYKAPPPVSHSNYPQPAAFSLYKLHGSVNWFQHKDDKSLVVDDRWTIRQAHDGRPPWHTSQLIKDNPTNNELAPLIVAPTIMKTSLFEPLKQQWEMAARAISTADILMFIGYSFPESDVFMRYFLSCALHQNSRLERLIIIDPNPPLLSGQTSGMFAAPYLRDVMNVWPLDWPSPVPIRSIVDGSYRLENDSTRLELVRRRKQASELRGNRF